MRVLPLSLLASLTSVLVIAAVHAAPPADATAVCNDGTYSEAASPDAACADKGGIKRWLKDGAAAQAQTTTIAVPMTISTSAMTDPLAAIAARMVWATPIGIYHCPADQWFGHTSDGHFMNEDDARAHGYRPNGGHVCNKAI